MQRRIHLSGRLRPRCASLFGWGVSFWHFAARWSSWRAGPWGASDLDSRYLDLFLHTPIPGAMAGVLTVAAAFVLAYANWYHGDYSTALVCASARSAMPLPGSVLAVGSCCR